MKISRLKEDVRYSSLSPKLLFPLIGLQFSNSYSWWVYTSWYLKV